MSNSEQAYPAHDFRKPLAHAKRKRLGYRQVRRCTRCGCIEHRSPNNLRAEYQVGAFMFHERPICDPDHKEIRKMLGLDEPVHQEPDIEQQKSLDEQDAITYVERGKV